jgi:hypothetical protein
MYPFPALEQILLDLFPQTPVWNKALEQVLAKSMLRDIAGQHELAWQAIRPHGHPFDEGTQSFCWKTAPYGCYLFLALSRSAAFAERRIQSAVIRMKLATRTRAIIMHSRITNEKKKSLSHRVRTQYVLS